ncbi:MULTISPECIES: hypothetical protein [unclassified Streptomyces]|uniref:hypothetical protein n=1 Tax=unclassified Streptomyces TaxID=2593676 RepID=UPI000AB7E22F|nr:hypothetical protein [Streptomyces sp. CNQ-509]
MRQRNNQTCVHCAPPPGGIAGAAGALGEFPTHLLHGLYYGLGTGLAGLLFWWVGQMI